MSQLTSPTRTPRAIRATVTDAPIRTPHLEAMSNTYTKEQLRQIFLALRFRSERLTGNPSTLDQIGPLFRVVFINKEREFACGPVPSRAQTRRPLNSCWPRRTWRCRPRSSKRSGRISLLTVTFHSESSPPASPPSQKRCIVLRNTVRVLRALFGQCSRRISLSRSGFFTFAVPRRLR